MTQGGHLLRFDFPSRPSMSVPYEFRRLVQDEICLFTRSIDTTDRQSIISTDLVSSSSRFVALLVQSICIERV